MYWEQIAKYAKYTYYAHTTVWSRQFLSAPNSCFYIWRYALQIYWIYADQEVLSFALMTVWHIAIDIDFTSLRTINL